MGSEIGWYEWWMMIVGGDWWWNWVVGGGIGDGEKMTVVELKEGDGRDGEWKRLRGKWKIANSIDKIPEWTTNYHDFRQ